MNFNRRHKKSDALVDLTPLIDVVFLLLIFFMVSTTFKAESKLLVELPKAGVTPPPEVEPLIVLSLDRSGVIEYRGNVLTLDALGDALQELAGGNRSRPIMLRADKEVTHGKVVAVMDIIRSEGFTALSIATRNRQQTPTKPTE